MISREFIIEEHEEYGSMGMRPLDMPNADPLGGMAVAHDLLEHFHNDNGSAEHEFMALGASLFIRDDCYYARNGKMITDPAQHLASELPQQYDYLMQRGDGLSIRYPGRTTKLDEDKEATLDRMFTMAKREMRDRGEPTWLNAKQCDNIRGWFRKGFRKAQLRYKGIDRVSDSQMMQYLFCQIEEAADRFIKMGFEGQRIRVSCSPKQGEFLFTELKDPYDY